MLVKERILTPLGMTNTGIVPTDEMQSHFSDGHNEEGRVSRWDIPTLAGSGALRSDITDMMKFLTANMKASSGSDPIYSAMRLSHQIHAMRYAHYVKHKKDER